MGLFNSILEAGMRQGGQQAGQQAGGGQQAGAPSYFSLPEDERTFEAMHQSPEGQAAIKKLQEGPRGENTYTGLQYAQAPDMSQFANLGSLQNMIPQAPQQAPVQMGMGYQNPFLRSLLGG